jgi:hypothetical protein
MSRDESDREDLMTEATALRERVELVVPGEPEHIIAGFRDNGVLALYFGPDPVFQFDAQGRLRRAYLDGDLYRSQSPTLARLTRTRFADEVNLVRHDLDADELARFLAAMQVKLTRLDAALKDGTTQIVRQVPPQVVMLPRLLHALDTARQGQLAPSIRNRR